MQKDTLLELITLLMKKEIHPNKNYLFKSEKNILFVP